MTCCIALKIKGRTKSKVIIGAESLTTLESTKLVNVCNESKIIKFNKFTMLICGNGPIKDLLEYIREEDEWQNHSLITRQDCINFVTHFLEVFQDRAPEMSQEELKYEFLFTNGEKIWWAISGPNVFEIDQYWAIGSGYQYALGYLYGCYNDIKTPEVAIEEIRVAIEAAIKFDQNCGLDIEVEEVKK